jgi:DHA2 family lincomycin resistance protein-like MFS transporter
MPPRAGRKVGGVNSSTHPTSAPQTEGRIHAPTILRILVLATFVVILNETIMVNAIPRLMDEFAVTERSAQWLSTAFMLTMAVVIPVTGWLLQRVTTRTAFGLAMALFVAGTALASASWSFPVLLMARIVQASGTAVMLPLLMTTLMTIVAPAERGKVMGNVTLVIAVAPALGPAVSGLLLQLGSWRLIFAVTLPIAVAMLAWGFSMLTDLGEPGEAAIDRRSVALAAVGFGGLVYGLSQLGSDEASTALPPALLAGVGMLCVTAFVWRQLRLQATGSPLLDLRTLTVRAFAVSLSLMCLSFMALMGAVIILPMYLQNVRGLSALTTGLVLMPGGLAMGLLGPTVGRLYDRRGARVLVVPGAIVLLACLTALSTVGESTPVAAILALHVVFSLALALIFTPVFTSGLAALPPHLYPHGSAVLGTLQQVAAAAGTAAVVAVLAIRQAHLSDQGASAAAALNGGVQWGFALAAVISLGVVVLAFLVPGAPAEEAIKPAAEPADVTG